MKTEEGLSLGSIQETLLLPLWGRAMETQKKQPMLVDQKAVSLIAQIPYDFSRIEKNINKMSRISWIARSVYFDKKIKEFIRQHPDASIVNIGCGLDTTFDRVDNGHIQWIDLDLPDTIALRKKYLTETDRNLFVAASVFDPDWYAAIRNKKEVLLLIAGVLYYFEETSIKQLLSDLHVQVPGAEAIFDYCSENGRKLANKKVIENGGMDPSALLKWAINDLREIENWETSLCIIENIPLFTRFKKRYPFYKRIGMNLSDRMKMMSVAHIRIQ